MDGFPTDPQVQGSPVLVEVQRHPSASYLQQGHSLGLVHHDYIIIACAQPPCNPCAS